MGRQLEKPPQAENGEYEKGRKPHCVSEVSGPPFVGVDGVMVERWKLPWRRGFSVFGVPSFGRRGADRRAAVGFGRRGPAPQNVALSH